MLTWLAIAVATLLAVALWSAKKHRDPKLAPLRCDRPLPELLPSLCGLTHSTLVEGNAVELLENEHYFDALVGTIAAARHTVHFETFLWKAGVLGRRVSAALAERARAGVTVRVILDARGARGIGADEERRMREAGCRIVRYHTVRPRNLGVLNRRDHRKVLVADGRVAMLGGHCIVDSWWSDTDDGPRFRDIGVRLQGPIVHSVQSAFSENWMAETGELFLGDGVFPRLARAGDVAAHVARAKPERASPAVKTLHHLVLCLAQRRLWIQNPYFLPQPAAISAMTECVQRGVDVRVMVPSAQASDMPLVQHAAHHNFERLLKAGVRVYEYQPTLIHQKVLSIDGVWCAIGSSNFDDRSFEINDEITLGLHSPALAQRLEAIFERDLAHCEELRLETWRRRSLWHRLKDRSFYLFREQL
ncbi:MAG: phospholipase D-like domain-containing protein [Pseudomonadota bacterium]